MSSTLTWTPDHGVAWIVDVVEALDHDIGGGPVLLCIMRMLATAMRSRARGTFDERSFRRLLRKHLHRVGEEQDETMADAAAIAEPDLSARVGRAAGHVARLERLTDISWRLRADYRRAGAA